MGISSVIAYAKAVWDGKSRQEAIDCSLCVGIQAGGTAFVSSVLSSQLTRTSLSRVLMKPSITVVRSMPASVRKALLQTLKSGSSKVFGGEATKDLAKLIRSNAIAMGAVLVTLSAGDIHNYFKGRISGKQLFKDISITVAGLGGSMLGAAVVSSILIASGGGTSRCYDSGRISWRRVRRSSCRKRYA